MVVTFNSIQNYTLNEFLGDNFLTEEILAGEGGAGGEITGSWTIGAWTINYKKKIGYDNNLSNYIWYLKY